MPSFPGLNVPIRGAGGRDVSKYGERKGGADQDVAKKAAPAPSKSERQSVRQTVSSLNGGWRQIDRLSARHRDRTSRR